MNFESPQSVAGEEAGEVGESEKTKEVAESEYNTSPEEVLELIDLLPKAYEEAVIKDNKFEMGDRAYSLLSWAEAAIKRKIPFDMERVRQTLDDAKKRGIIAADQRLPEAGEAAEA